MSNESIVLIIGFGIEAFTVAIFAIITIILLLKQRLTSDKEEELLAKYKELVEQKNAGFRRLLRAFPNMISRNQNEMLQKYREYLASRKNKQLTSM